MEMMTQEEKQALEARLNALLENRKAISVRIAEAREQGDLSENADYHAAREDQGMQEAEIRRLTERLAQVSVIDDDGAHKTAGVVFVGAKVRLREVGGDEDEIVKLVGDSSMTVSSEYFEATVSSPMGEALMKSRVGETISVRGPRGVSKFEILEIL